MRSGPSAALTRGLDRVGRRLMGSRVSAPYANLPLLSVYGSVAKRVHGRIVAPLDLRIRWGAKLLYRFVVDEIEGSWLVLSIGLLAYPPNRLH